jgi:hypothetical protein
MPLRSSVLEMSLSAGKKHPGDEGVWLALELHDRLKAHYERLQALQIPSAEDKQKSS